MPCKGSDVPRKSHVDMSNGGRVEVKELRPLVLRQEVKTLK